MWNNFHWKQTGTCQIYNQGCIKDPTQKQVRKNKQSGRDLWPWEGLEEKEITLPGGKWFKPHIGCLSLGSNKGKMRPLAGWRANENSRGSGKAVFYSWGALDTHVAPKLGGKGNWNGNLTDILHDHSVPPLPPACAEQMLQHCGPCAAYSPWSKGCHSCGNSAGYEMLKAAQTLRVVLARWGAAVSGDGTAESVRKVTSALA